MSKENLTSVTFDNMPNAVAMVSSDVSIIKNELNYSQIYHEEQTDPKSPYYMYIQVVGIINIRCSRYSQMTMTRAGQKHLVTK